MKKLNYLICTLAVLLLLSGCCGGGYSSSRLLESEFQDTRFTSQIELSLRSAVDSESLRVPLRFKNTGSSDCSYDSMRRLEVKLGGSWYIVPDSDPAVPLSEYRLPAGSSADSELSLQGHYGPLPAGSYRIIKEFTLADGRELCAAAEFSVKRQPFRFPA